MEKRTAFILIKKTLLKIKSCSFRPNKARYEKMLWSKIVDLKEIYNFDFDHFFIKHTVFVLIVKNAIKNKKFNFLAKLYGVRKMYQIKVVVFKKLYIFYIKHFLILNIREFKLLKNYINVYRKSSVKHEYRDENVFLKVHWALGKLITL